MNLPLLISLIALKLVQAKHFLVQTEDKKVGFKEEVERFEEDNSELLTEKQVKVLLGALPQAGKAEQIYNNLSKSVQNAIRKKLHKSFGNDQKAVRLPLTL